MNEQATTRRTSHGLVAEDRNNDLIAGLRDFLKTGDSAHIDIDVKDGLILVCKVTLTVRSANGFPKRDVLH